MSATTTIQKETPKEASKMETKQILRVEDRRLLTGRGAFVDDTKVSSMCYATIIGSSFAHAKIKSIDASEALKVPGVVGILTGKEVGEMSDPFPVGISNAPRYYCAAVDKARYVGEPVAIVVARDKATAEDAAELVKVEYESLPVVVDVEEAIKEGAPILHEYLGTNIAMHRHLRYGDLEKGFQEAEVTVEGKFRFPKYTSAPLETFAIIAKYDEALASLNLYCNFQGPWTMFSLITKALRMSPEQVRINVTKDNGGGFGIKSSMYPQMVLVSLASKKLQVPIKWIEDRREHLLSGSSGTDRVAYCKLGAKKDGKLTGIYFKFMDNMGGYVRAPEPGNLFRPLGNVVGAYTVRNLELDAYAIMTNKCPTGPNRGYGCQHIYFCLEGLMDMLSEKLGIGPDELRMRNLIGPSQMPYTTPSGGVYDSGDYPAAFAKALDLVGYDKWRERQRELRNQKKFIGIGIGVGVDPSVSNMGYVTIAYDAETRAKPDYLPKSGGSHIVFMRVDPFGKVLVRVDSNPQGQGHETVVTQIVAQELGLKPEDIIVNSDFSTSENAWSVSAGTYSSRFGSVGTSATVLAAREIKEKVFKIAANALKVRATDLEIGNGYVFVKDSPNKKISFRHVAGIAHWNPAGMPEGMEPGLFAMKQYNIKTLKPPNAEDQVNSSGTYGFVAEIAVVEVDPDSGKVKLLDFSSVHDAGKIIHHQIVEGQVHGSFMHGLAAALYEELAYDNEGQLLASTFMDYLAPTSMESFEPKIAHVETPCPFTILGSKGVGEASSETTPVAIGRAVADAIAPLGMNVTELPLSPEKVWRLVREGRAKTK